MKSVENIAYSSKFTHITMDKVVQAVGHGACTSKSIRIMFGISDKDWRVIDKLLIKARSEGKIVFIRETKSWKVKT